MLCRHACPHRRMPRRWLSDRVRVLIYSGDVDGCVPTFGTETFFLRSLGMDIESAWQPWRARAMSGRLVRAGYHEKFGGTRHGIDFITFAGAGHMVPQYKAPESLAVLRRWLSDSSLLDDERVPARAHAATTSPRQERLHHVGV
jgi:Serine carboxypeptidase